MINSPHTGDPKFESAPEALRISIYSLGRQIEEKLRDMVIDAHPEILISREPFGFIKHGKNADAPAKIAALMDGLYNTRKQKNGLKGGPIIKQGTQNIIVEEIPVNQERLNQEGVLGAVSYQVTIDLAPRYQKDGKPQTFTLKFTTVATLGADGRMGYNDESKMINHPVDPATGFLPVENQIPSRLQMATYWESKPRERGVDVTATEESIARFQELAARAIKRPWQGGAPGLKSQN